MIEKKLGFASKFASHGNLRCHGTRALGRVSAVSGWELKFLREQVPQLMGRGKRTAERTPVKGIQYHDNSGPPKRQRSSVVIVSTRIYNCRNQAITPTTSGPPGWGSDRNGETHAKLRTYSFPALIGEPIVTAWGRNERLQI